MKRLLVATAILPLTLPMALAQEAGAPSAAGASPSVTELESAIRSGAELGHVYLTAMESPDLAVRASALHVALQSPDASIRLLAIAGYLKPYPCLSPEAVRETGSPVGREDLPSLAVCNVKWNDTGLAFTGDWHGDGCGNTGYGVHGSVSGGRVILSYDHVCVKQKLTGPTAPKSNEGENFIPVTCDLVLAAPPREDATARNMLVGSLDCVNVRVSLKAELSFGM